MIKLFATCTSYFSPKTKLNLLKNIYMLYLVKTFQYICKNNKLKFKLFYDQNVKCHNLYKLK